MQKEEKIEFAATGIYAHVLKARTDVAAVFPHSPKIYKAFVSNYQGVKLSKSAIKALGKI